MQKLRNQILPQTKALIWIEKQSLSKNSQYFEEINYLVNGLLVDLINFGDLSSDLTFLDTPSFDHNLKIFHIIKNDQLSSNLRQIEEHISDFTNEDQIVLISEQGKVNLKTNAQVLIY